MQTLFSYTQRQKTQLCFVLWIKTGEEEGHSKNKKPKQNKTKKTVPHFFAHKRHVVIKNQLKSLSTKEYFLNVCGFKKAFLNKNAWI